MFVHTLEFLSELNNINFLLNVSLDFFMTGFDDLMELSHSGFISIQLNIMISLGKGCNQLAAGFGHHF